MKLLLIEDEKSVSDFIVAGLTKNGFEVDCVADGSQGFHQALSQDYDLVILDLNLPGMDGIEILRGLREAGRATRVLILTSRSNVEHRIAGLEAGSDAYLAKPFDFGELLAVVRSLLRRTPLDVSAGLLRYKDLELDARRKYVTRGGRELKLTAKQFAILEHLMRNQNSVVPRQDLAKHIWSSEPQTSNNVIDVTVHLLRESVDRGFGIPLIHTVRGVGYQLGGPHLEMISAAQRVNSSQPNRSTV